MSFGVILFVHGMGHTDNRDYWKNWAGLLAPELARQGLDLNDEQFSGVYYYDLVPGPGGETGEAEVVKAHIATLRKNAEMELSLQRNFFAGKLGLIKKIAGKIVDNFGDIFSYLYINETHQMVNERLYEAIFSQNRPLCLIGYSLGSIVCYCALKKNYAAAQKVSHLIMLASPIFWFKHGVTERVDLDKRPPVGRFTNIAGVLDIAMPQMVQKVIHGFDENIQFTVNPFDPVRGHNEYFSTGEGLKVIAGEIKKGWV